MASKFFERCVDSRNRNWMWSCARLRSVMSLAMTEKPSRSPCAFAKGATLIATSISCPDLEIRTVSCGSDSFSSSKRACVRIVLPSCCGGNKMFTFRPRISCAAYPYSCSAARFHVLMVPSKRQAVDGIDRRADDSIVAPAQFLASEISDHDAMHVLAFNR